jgi:hypothetical protein
MEVNGICTQDMYSQNIHTLIGTHKSTPNANINTLRLMVYTHKKCIHKISTRDGLTKYPHSDRHTQESTKRKYPHIEVNGLCTTRNVLLHKISTLSRENRRVHQTQISKHWGQWSMHTRDVLLHKISALLWANKSPPNPNIHTLRSIVYAHKKWINKISALW